MPRALLKTTWEYISAFPPPYCRLLGKEDGGGPHDMSIPDAVVAIRSEIPINRVREISIMPNWDNVPVSEMRRFLAACNFDPTNPLHRERVQKYEKICQKRKTTPFHYLRRSPKWETEFLPLLLMVSQTLKLKNGLSPKDAISITHARS